MENKYLFEYVLSGIDYPRQVSAYEGNILDPEHKELFTNAMKDIYSSLKAKGFKLSLLFNALTEISYIPYTQEMRESLFKVHADSGGLQMVTQNMAVDAQGKRDIYDRQGQNADVAMSYDSIPVINTSSGNSNNAENKTKVIDDGNIKIYAEKTAKSFMEQFLYFFQKGYTESDPFLIIHGYDYHSYSLWYNIVTDYLPNEIVDNLGGVAIGGAGLNSGEYLEIEKAMFLADLKDISHVHLLGVGSPTKAAIHASFILADKYNFELSADSTTHTSSLSRGAAIINGRAKHLKNEAVFDAVEMYAEKELGEVLKKYNVKIARNLAYESISVASKSGATQQLLLEMFLTSMIVVIFSVHNFFLYSIDTEDSRIAILRNILKNGDPHTERNYLKQKFKFNKINRTSDEANSLATLI